MLDRVRRALVVEPHPDDLAIGAGGLIRRLVDGGCEVHSLQLSEVPEEYRKTKVGDGAYEQYAGATRAAEAAAADTILGVSSRTVVFGQQWHHQLDRLALSEVISAMETFVLAMGCDLVLIPARSYNQDHRVAHDAFKAVMRPHLYAGPVLAYETTHEREFHPNFLVPLTEEHLGVKVEACAQFQTQLGAAAHLFSVESVEVGARYRGREVFASAAEAFELIRGGYPS
jgi:N-acetylglucosamine malate deacetylase 1